MCRQDFPSRREKEDMCQSIIDSFPCLKDPVTGGFVSVIMYAFIPYRSALLCHVIINNAVVTLYFMVIWYSDVNISHCYDKMDLVRNR